MVIDFASPQIWLVSVVLFGLCIAAASVGLVLWQQQRQLRATLASVCAQVDIFADASVAVAQTVEQALVLERQQSSTAMPNTLSAPTVARRELLQVAQRRLAQQQEPQVVQQTLALRDDELRLLCVAMGTGAGAVPQAQPQGHQAVA